MIRQVNRIIVLKLVSLIYDFKVSFFWIKSNSRIRDLKISLSEVSRFEYSGHQIGLGIQSSLTDLSVDGRISSSLFYRYIPELLIKACQIYEVSKRIIHAESPCKIVQFNPRFSSTMPIYFAAKEYTENVFYFENASSSEKYSIFKGSIFDGRNREMDIKKKWENGSRDKEEIGHSFFKTSPNIIYSNNELLLSDYIHKDKTNIFFFPSSIHETFSLGELYHHPHFSGQTECIKWLSNYFTSRDRFNFVVREHPILANKTLKERDEWRCLFNDYKIKFIPFDCELSTYEILKKIDAVVVYHSTVAIEAAYRNIPAMALGSPWYIGLDSVFAPKNLREIDSFLNNPNRYISDAGLTTSLMYGYYIKTYGTLYRYTKFIKKFISY